MTPTAAYQLSEDDVRSHEDRRGNTNMSSHAVATSILNESTRGYEMLKQYFAPGNIEEECNQW